MEFECGGRRSKKHTRDEMRSRANLYTQQSAGTADVGHASLMRPKGAGGLSRRAVREARPLRHNPNVVVTVIAATLARGHC
jgi:hypothetical protein